LKFTLYAMHHETANYDALRFCKIDITEP